MTSLPEPFYQDESATIYCADCREILPLLPKVDLVVTSPPYNLGSNHHTGSKKTQCYDDNMPECEYQRWQVLVLSLCWAKCVGDCFYNHQHRIRNGRIIKPDSWIDSTPWFQKQEIVWNHGSQNFDKVRFYPFTERIYWLSKEGSETEFANNVGLSDDWHISPVGASGEHTRQFPIEIASNIIACCNSGTILDPFMGSGTTLRAAKDLGRKAIGIEINPAYCEIAKRRLAQMVLPL